jgi:RHS repeat-associated protein
VDAITGLYYFGARFYDPAIGRFISADSYIGTDIDPLSLNRYIYARGNPEKYIDPTGHMFCVTPNGGGGSDSATPNKGDQISSEQSSSASVETNAVESTVSNNGLSSGEIDSIAVTAACFAAAIVLCVGTLGLGTPMALAVICASAGLSSGVYTAIAGQTATLAGSLIAAASGAASAGVGILGSTVAAASSPFYGTITTAVGSTCCDLCTDELKSLTTGSQFQVSYSDFIDIAISTATMSQGNDVEYSIEKTLGIGAETKNIPGEIIPSPNEIKALDTTLSFATTGLFQMLSQVIPFSKSLYSLKIP